VTDPETDNRKRERAKWWHSARLEAAMYLRHIRGLALPGIKVETIVIHPTEPASLDGWGDDALHIIVDEARRQIDRQSERFDRIRTTAQLLFTTALALLVVLAAGAHRVLDQESVILFVAWVVGLIVVALGMLGAASILTVRAEFGTIDTPALTYHGPDPLKVLATAYAQQVRVGESTVAARLTVYRDAVWLVLLGAAIQLVVWLTGVA
jgi:hypothetical protein